MTGAKSRSRLQTDSASAIRALQRCNLQRNAVYRRQPDRKRLAS